MSLAFQFHCGILHNCNAFCVCVLYSVPLRNSTLLYCNAFCVCLVRSISWRSRRWSKTSRHLFCRCPTPPTMSSKWYGPPASNRHRWSCPGCSTEIGGMGGHFSSKIMFDVWLRNVQIMIKDLIAAWCWFGCESPGPQNSFQSVLESVSNMLVT